MDEKIEVISYEITVEKMDLKLYTKNRKLYDYMLATTRAKELFTGFVLNKANKPNKQGTKIKFKKIEKAELVDFEMERIRKSISKYI